MSRHFRALYGSQIRRSSGLAAGAHLAPTAVMIRSIPLSAIYLSGAIVCAACSGFIVDPDKNEDEDTTEAPPGAASPSAPTWTTAYARLSHSQYDKTVSDLLHLAKPSTKSQSFVGDGEGGLFGNESSSSSVGEALAKDYERAAGELALEATTNESGYQELVAGASTSQEFIGSFLPRCYRRPVTADESAAYAAVFESCPQEIDTGHTDAFRAGVSCAIRACLQDPSFLYRVEVGGWVTDGIAPLTPHEIASRLSYLIWNTMPSEELFDKAASGGLDTPEKVRAVALEMVDDPRAGDVFSSFHTRWLEIDGVEDLSLSPDLFPAYEPGIGSELRAETERFVRRIVTEGGSFERLITSREAELTAATAAVYGVGPDSTSLPEAERAGVLTRAAFLAKFSDGDNTSPILRGRWFKDRVLCMTLKPPDEVPPIGAPTGDMTMREFVEKGTACGINCHQVLNPPGFALEHYNALGAYRDHELNGLPIDAKVSYLLDQKEIEIDGGVELSREIGGSIQANACYVRHWIQFVLARPHGDGDAAFAEALAVESLAGMPIREILPRLVTTPAFLNRVVDEPEEKAP